MESIVDEVVCSICLSIFKEPQMLRCGHNFCLSCLLSCFPGGMNKAKCPDCRQPFSQQELTCNRVLANIAHQVRLTQEPPQTVPEVVEICTEHNEPLKLCCKQDQVSICELCRDLPQHKGHNFLPIISAEKYTKNNSEEIMTFVSKEFEALHKILNEKEQDLKKTVETMAAENVQQMMDALNSLKEKDSSQTMMQIKIKNAFENAECIASLRAFKQLIERVKAFQIQQPQNDDVVVISEKDSAVIEFPKWTPQDYDDSVSEGDDYYDDNDEDDDDDDEISDDDQSENENQVNFQGDANFQEGANFQGGANLDNLWNWEYNFVGGGGDKQVPGQDNPGGWQVVQQDGGFGGCYTVSGDRAVISRTILTLGNGTWSFEGNVPGGRLSFAGDQNPAGRLGSTRRQRMRLGTHQINEGRRR